MPYHSKTGLLFWFDVGIALYFLMFNTINWFCLFYVFIYVKLKILYAKNIYSRKVVMQYEDALNWVFTLPRVLKSPGIENTKALLNLLGNPEKNLHFVHVAGTNGKGSTVMMLMSILQTAGYKTGATISPYVLDFKERFWCNNKMITKKDCARILTKVKKAADKLENYVAFDIVTAAALLYFAEQKCDIVCLETGIGGRLDSSNAVQNTLVACIMSISSDHTELLGRNLTQIASEKCGIIKNNCSVITYPKQQKQVLNTIKEITQEKNSKLVIPNVNLLQIKSHDKPKVYSNTTNNLIKEKIYYGGKKISVPFAGKHQAYNAAVAIYAALELKSTTPSFNIEDEHIINGIKKARFAARIEILSKKPLLIIDGAHNISGAKALVSTLESANINKPIGVIGTLKRKDIKQIIKVLSPFFGEIYTVTPNSPRALNAQILAKYFSKAQIKATPYNNIKSAIDEALLKAKKEDKAIVICGSLYTASEARVYIIKKVI